VFLTSAQQAVFTTDTESGKRPLRSVGAVAAGLAPLLHDGRLAVTQDPYSPRAAFLLACGEPAVRDPAGFALALQCLATLSPGHPALAMLAARFRLLQTSVAPAL
jgi:hypothetical protein